MSKRVFIVHGWEGFPEECWFPWLKKKLEEKGIEAIVPAMPDPGAPKIETWVAQLEDAVAAPDEETYFVGHSIGVQTILRYLESINARVGGLVAVAGFFTLTDDAFDDEEDIKTAKPWLVTPIDFEKVKANCPAITAIFSDNDPFVPLENQALFERELGAKTIIASGKGHIGGNDNIFEFEPIFDELMAIVNK